MKGRRVMPRTSEMDFKAINADKFFLHRASRGKIHMARCSIALETKWSDCGGLFDPSTLPRRTPSITAALHRMFTEPNAICLDLYAQHHTGKAQAIANITLLPLANEQGNSDTAVGFINDLSAQYPDSVLPSIQRMWRMSLRIAQETALTSDTAFYKMHRTVRPVAINVMTRTDKDSKKA